ncbi:MAG: hypothetical protein H7836_04585 [Magnetococcus sp. YQC-3]
MNSSNRALKKVETRANEKLDTNTIARLGLSREEFQDMSKSKYNCTIEDFVELNQELVVAKINQNMSILNIEGYEDFPVKKDDLIVMRMINFIKLFHKNRVSPTNLFKRFYNTYRGEDLNNKNIGIWIYNAGIGDVIFISSVLRQLKIKYPRCYITMFVPQPYMEFVNSWGLANMVMSNVFHFKYFYNCDYHLNFEFIIRSKEGELFNCYYNLFRRSFLQVSVKEAYPQFPPDPAFRKLWINILKEKNIDNFIIVNFNSSNPMRCGSDKFSNNVLDMLKEYNIIFIDNKFVNDKIDKLIEGRSNCYNFTMLSGGILQSIALVSLARIVISVDTGMAHFSVGVGTPLFGIYGPFPAENRIATYPNTKWVNAYCPSGKGSCCEHDCFFCEYWDNNGPECYNNIDLNKMKKDIDELVNLDINKKLF